MPQCLRRRAVFVIVENVRPHPRRAYGRRMHLENTADDNAFGKHVEVIIVPFARRPRGRSAFEDQRGHLVRLSHIATAPPARSRLTAHPSSYRAWSRSRRRAVSAARRCLKAAVFSTMAHSGRRQCRSSSNDVSLPLKSYDLPASGRNNGHRWTSQKCHFSTSVRKALHYLAVLLVFAACVRPRP